ncbi:reverse transcriptase domain-containing protein [Roseiconus lacunae]|uniref:Reverse transcriptase domain-containing protein n=1 Tax=Roseiconus lacunae TaxID=2605694 RepID=A0ABT7PS97_9BACT|nr:reverse transcriptase domain-containing protein [Roseiconus lacunae]MDM4019377.1 reverse transcriptase domain-containing protein [Roseiconus lacunae]
MKASLRRATKARDSFYRVPANDRDFSLAKLADKDNLFRAFKNLQAHGGDGVGLDGATFSDFSPSEVFSVLRQVSLAIKDKTYRPSRTRTVPIPKPDGDTRDLELQTVIDRTVAKSLQLALLPLAQQRLPRLTQSVVGVYKELHDTVRRTRQFWLAPDDIKKCFDNVSVEAVMDSFRDRFSNPDLLWLIETVVRGFEGPERHVGESKGISQGCPFSPMAMEWLLHSRLDIPFAQQTSSQTLLRYVDNLLVVCSDAQSGEQALAVCKELLAPLRMKLKHAPEDNPFDLREPSNDRSILGFNPVWTDQLQLGIPSGTYDALRKKLVEAHRTPNPGKQAMSVINGFINAYGPAMTVPDRPTIISRLFDVLAECKHWEYPSNRLCGLAEKAYGEWSKPFVPGDT